MALASTAKLTKPKQEFDPTPEQQAAIKMCLNGRDMKLIAFAGAGKTSTLVLLAKELNKQGKTGLYLAFNKAIADEAAKKMPNNVVSKTFHSLAYANAPNHIKSRLQKDCPSWEFQKIFRLTPFSVRVRETEIDYQAILRGDVEDDADNPPKRLVSVKSSLISAVRQKYIIDTALTYFMRSDRDFPEIEDVHKAIKNNIDDILKDDIEVLAKELFPVVETLWRDFISPSGVIGMRGRHDVYLKLWALSKPKIKTDFILFDESQDADPLMTGILREQEAQIIYVGDPYQQIYGWRGAVNVMQDLKVQASYLTQSFRFGQDLADACQPLLEVLGSENSIRGLDSLTTVVDVDDKLPSSFDALLCRTNAGAIKACLEYQGLGILVTPMNVDFKETREMVLGIEELRKLGRTECAALRGFPSYDSLQEFVSEYKTDTSIAPYYRLNEKFGVETIIELIDRCESDKSKKVKGSIATTAHRSKGLEWDTVVLNDDFCGAFQNYTGEFKEKPNEEEYRLLYVAMTRAKKKAYFAQIQNILLHVKSKRKNQALNAFDL